MTRTLTPEAEKAMRVVATDDADRIAPEIVKSRIRYVRAVGSTNTDMHINMQHTPLYRLGDCILVWVNEGDFWAADPIDVEAGDRDRK